MWFVSESKSTVNMRSSPSGSFAIKSNIIGESSKYSSNTWSVIELSTGGSLILCTTILIIWKSSAPNGSVAVNSNIKVSELSFALISFDESIWGDVK